MARYPSLCGAFQSTTTSPSETNIGRASPMRCAMTVGHRTPITFRAFLPLRPVVVYETSKGCIVTPLTPRSRSRLRRWTLRRQAGSRPSPLRYAPSAPMQRDASVTFVLRFDEVPRSRKPALPAPKLLVSVFAAAPLNRLPDLYFPSVAHLQSSSITKHSRRDLAR